MKDLSPTAWIVIILLIGIIVSTNLSLVFALRNRSRKSPPSEPSRALNTLKNPWEAEDRQWNQLSEKVKNLTTQTNEESTQKEPKD